MAELILHSDELEEDFREKDLFERDNKILNYLTKKLYNLEKSGIVGIVGPFGCGKTTFINQIIKRDSVNKSSLWLNFDARKYPNRDDLRENFILDMAEYLDEKGKSLVVNELSGKSTSLFDASFRDAVGYLNKFIPTIREYIFDRQKRELDIVEKLLRQIFISLHTKIDGGPIDTIYIVIEDIDRSGDSGVYFLQTLNYFLKKIEIGEGLKVIAIATIGSIEYRGCINSYLKSIDHIHTFPIRGYNYGNMFKYFLYEKCYVHSFVEFVNYIGSSIEGFTPRTLKHILRDLSLLYDEFDITESNNLLIDKTGVLLGMLVAKYVNIPGENRTFLDRRKYEGIGLKGDDVFKSFFLSVANRSYFVDENDEGIEEIINPNIYENKAISYRFIDFRYGDDRLICRTGTNDMKGFIINIDKKLFVI